MLIHRVKRVKCIIIEFLLFSYIIKNSKPNEGKFISSALEFDVFFEDQTQRADFDSIAEHSTILNMGSDSLVGGVLIDFHFNYKR